MLAAYLFLVNRRHAPRGVLYCKQDFSFMHMAKGKNARKEVKKPKKDKKK